MPTKLESAIGLLESASSLLDDEYDGTGHTIRFWSAKLEIDSVIADLRST